MGQNVTFSLIQWLKCLSRQKDNKTKKDKKTKRQQYRTFRFSLESICRNGSESHILSDSMAQVSFSINLLLEVSSVSGHVTDRISEPVDSWI